MLIRIRAIVVVLHFCFVFFLGLILCILRPFNPRNIYLTARMLSSVGFKILGIEFEKRGFEKLDESIAAVYLSNHQNNVDVFPGGASILPGTVILGKDTIKWIPFFGQFFWLSGCIFIKRGNLSKARSSMEKVTEKITKNNTSIWIMPEGTRNKGKGLLPFKKGAFITAVNAQVPLIPICFNNYSQYHDYNKFKSGKIISLALDPIPTKGLSKEDIPALIEKTHKLMSDAINKLDKEILG